MTKTAKKQFEWDDTQLVGEVMINDKKKVVTEFNMRMDDNGMENWYISLVTMQLFKNSKLGQTQPEWNITKNATFPLETFVEISELVRDNVDVDFLNEE